MKKLIIAVMFFTLVSLFSSVSYAADTETSVMLDGRAHFMMELKSNTLVFRNAPINKEHKSVAVYLKDESTYGNGLLRVATCRGKSNGDVLDLSRLVDGTYTISVGFRDSTYLGDYQVHYVAPSCDESTLSEQERNLKKLNDRAGVESAASQTGTIHSKIMDDLDGDGSVESYETVDFPFWGNSENNLYCNSFDGNGGPFFKNFERFRSFAVSLVIKDGKPNFQAEYSYANNLKELANEKTDAYALDSYRQPEEQLSVPYQAYLVKQAQSIVAGITDDYDKVKAIHDWVAKNIWYNYDALNGINIKGSENYFNPDDTGYRGVDGIESVAGDRMVCGGYAFFTANLLRAAGFPAKMVIGSATGENHAWTEVYVDNRWLFMDTTWDSNNIYQNGKFLKQATCDEYYFDMPMAVYSMTHKIDAEYFEGDDKRVWDGCLTFISPGRSVLERVPNFPINDLVTSTYELEAEGFYQDPEYTKPWDFATGRINSRTNMIYVKNPSKYFTITFVSLGGTPIDAMKVRTRESENYQVAVSGPANPTRNGYKFIGWHWNSSDGSDWDFATDVISSDCTLYAVWEKIQTPVTYTVIFNSNGGTAVKALTINTNSTITKPATPTRKGYVFVNWCKDRKCTKVWNFTKNNVTSNITLYALWKKKVD